MTDEYSKTSVLEDDIYLRQLLNHINTEQHISDTYLHLTANENIMSETARKCLSSKLSYRYLLGTSISHSDENPVCRFGDLSLIALNNVYQLESTIRTLCQSSLHCAISDFRPLSGMHAMMCTIINATSIGDTVLSIGPSDGGHFATHTLLNKLGRKAFFMRFDETMTIDLNHTAELLRVLKPRAIIFDHSATLTDFPLQQIRNIAGTDLLMIFDASHTLGLIVGGCFQNPLLEGCDILQGNTHKTFPGPQKAFIHYRDFNFGNQMISETGSALVSSQHTHHTLALFVTILEMSAFGRQYSIQMISNARTLCKHLLNYGFELVGVGEHTTNTNLILINMQDDNRLRDACSRLAHAGISTNARKIYNKNVLRIGTQEITRRGMKEDEMHLIAIFFKRLIIDREDPLKLRNEIAHLNNNFHSIYFSFDGAIDADN